jgi:hypothetical protein
MLRRLVDGLLIALVAWFALARLDAGGVAIGLVLAAVFLFTGWRIAALWRKYRHLLRERDAAQAALQSDDAAERERAERTLNSRRLQHAAELTLWSGFIMGAAASDPGPASGFGHDGTAGGDDWGDQGGGFGGDLGGGGFDGGGM